MEKIVMKITKADIGYYSGKSNSNYALILNLSESLGETEPIGFVASLIISPVNDGQFCHKTFSEILDKLIKKTKLKSYSSLIGMEIDCYLGEEYQIVAIGIGKEGYGYEILKLKSIHENV